MIPELSQQSKHIILAWQNHNSWQNCSGEQEVTVLHFRLFLLLPKFSLLSPLVALSLSVRAKLRPWIKAKLPNFMALPLASSCPVPVFQAGIHQEVGFRGIVSLAATAAPALPIFAPSPPVVRCHPSQELTQQRSIRVTSPAAIPAASFASSAPTCALMFLPSYLSYIYVYIYIYTCLWGFFQDLSKLPLEPEEISL